MEELKSEGKCLFCGKMFAKAGINRHLSTHLKQKTNRKGMSYLVKVETRKRWGLPHYFLSLWIDGEAKLSDIDDFLRGIWLECCGHLSAFIDPERKPQRDGGMYGMFNILDDFDMSDDDGMLEEFEGDIPMKKKAKTVFYKGKVVDYEYDFGSTTELTVTVIEEYPVKADSKIVLLSRNEPLPVICNSCGKAPATQACSVCMDDEAAEFCDKCAKKHAKKCADFEDYAAMPIVNSPRAGVCGYTGGVIDTERDSYHL